MGPRKSYTEKWSLSVIFRDEEIFSKDTKTKKIKNILGRESSVNQKTESVN